MTRPNQINSVFVATRNFPDKKLRVFNLIDAYQESYLEYWSPAYDQIEKLFELNEQDLMIVLMCKSVEIPNLASSVKKFISQFKYDRIFIFLEEIVSLYHKIEGHPIGKTSRYPIPSKDLIHCEEYEFVRKITKGIDRSKIEIFHCEYNIDAMADSQSVAPVKYFDWCIVDQISAIYQSLITDPDNLPSLGNSISKKISCFNYRYSDERYYISCILSRYPDVDFSQYYRISYQKFSDNLLNIEDFNDSIKNKVYQGTKILKEKPTDWHPIPSKPGDPRPILPVLSYESTRELITRINRSFLHLVTETRYSTPFANFSEKTLRCLYAQRPFILLAAPGTLSLLKELGIKTFSDYWDESYDSVEDPVLRFEKVTKIVEDILNKDIEELQEMLYSMQPILEHNCDMFDLLPEQMKKFSENKNKK